MTRRLFLLAVVAGGVVLWRGGFGFLATERTVTWRFPVRYPEVRRLELQLWAGPSLVRREEQVLPAGLTAEPTTRLPLERGPHRALATLWLESGAPPLALELQFDPGTDGDIVLSFPPRRP